MPSNSLISAALHSQTKVEAVEDVESNTFKEFGTSTGGQIGLLIENDDDGFYAKNNKHAKKVLFDQRINKLQKGRLDIQDIGRALGLADQSDYPVSGTASNAESSEEECDQVELNDVVEDQLTNEKLKRLEQIFRVADEDAGGGLDMDEFRKAMRITMGDHVSNNELDMIFMKVDTNCDGTVDWDEYLTYMLLQCRELDQMNVQAQQPFPRYFRRIRCNHKDSVIRILFLPSLHSPSSQDTIKKLNPLNGRYITASKEGVFSFWNQNLKPLATYRVEDDTPGKKNKIWVTDTVCIARASMIVLSTTARELIFYDNSANRFERLCRIIDLEYCPMSLGYWTHSSRSCNPVLLWGDDGGGVSAIVFQKYPQLTALNKKRQEDAVASFSFRGILHGSIEHLQAFYLPKVHNDIVKQVTYVGNFDCFISCSKDSHTAMFVGDLKSKIMSSYFRVYRGITTFDYNAKFNIIVTGGYDAVVRVWNPYVPSNPSILLRGHKAPILHVFINALKEHVISIAENKEIRIHDMSTQLCIQTFVRNMVPGMGPRSISGALFQPARQSLLFATTTLAVLEHQENMIKYQELTTHHKAVTAALYNPLFNQVVSAGGDSMVCVWNLFSGQKVMQYRAHTQRRNGQDYYMEVTAMSFDPTYRRLLTAGRDGTIRIWNFNNGACLRELELDGHCEVTSIVWQKQRVIVGGWDKRITIFKDHKEDDSSKCLHPEHAEDILAMSFCPPNILASASYDGHLYIWSLSTMRRLRCTKLGLRKWYHMTQDLKTASLESTIEEQEDIVQPDIVENNDQAGLLNIKRKILQNKKAVKFDNVVTLNKTVSQHRRASWKPEGTETKSPRRGTVEKLYFLTSREVHPETANLFGGCLDGYIRAWSISHVGGLLGQFKACRRDEDPITCIISSTCNNFLISGDCSGYIRVWDISHYLLRGIQCSEENDAEREEVWNQFPFYRMLRNITQRNATIRRFLPEVTEFGVHLVNSFRAHLTEVSNLDYVSERDFLVSSGLDCSVRLWSVTGQFLGIFGQKTIFDITGILASTGGYEMPDNDGNPHRTRGILLPPDVRKEASATTLRVLYSGRKPRWTVARNVFLWTHQQSVKGKKQSDDKNITVDQQKEDDIECQNLPSLKSLVLGKSYKRTTCHKPLPTLHKPISYSPRWGTYRALPYVEADLSETVWDQAKVNDIRKRYQLRPLQETRNAARMMKAYRKVAFWPGTVGKKSLLPAKGNSLSNRNLTSTHKKSIIRSKPLPAISKSTDTESTESQAPPVKQNASPANNVQQGRKQLKLHAIVEL